MLITPFTIRLRRRRDLLLARYRARQLARLLDLSPVEQARLAAAVFDLARAAHEQPTPAALRFEVTDRAIYVDAVGSPGLMILPRVRQPLPAQGRLAREDVGWAMQQLARLAPFRVFEEIEQQNRDVRVLLQELNQSQHDEAAIEAGESSQAA